MKPPVIQKSFLQLSLLTLALFVVQAAAQGIQDKPAPQISSPPPLKIIVKQDRLQLDGARDAKARVRISMELAGAHLTYAEGCTTQQDYDGASAELGKYQALLENVLNYLTPLSRDQNKTRDLYKRLELSLRAHGPRLTSIRRITPLEYAVWVKEIEDFARKGRTDALNSFYGHTVMREPQKTSEEKSSTKHSKDDPPLPEDKP
ncbi:MAG: hypothetical protein ABJB97_02120 [Acidobacteriota bacterium]